MSSFIFVCTISNAITVSHKSNGHSVNNRLSASALIYILPVKDAAFIQKQRLLGSATHFKTCIEYIVNKRSTY
jgi:hypothetical protein